MWVMSVNRIKRMICSIVLTYVTSLIRMIKAIIRVGSMTLRLCTNLKLPNDSLGHNIAWIKIGKIVLIRVLMSSSIRPMALKWNQRVQAVIMLAYLDVLIVLAFLSSVPTAGVSITCLHLIMLSSTLHTIDLNITPRWS
jgi:hypothetical protein